MLEAGKFRLRTKKGGGRVWRRKRVERVEVCTVVCVGFVPSTGPEGVGCKTTKIKRS